MKSWFHRMARRFSLLFSNLRAAVALAWRLDRCISQQQYEDMLAKTREDGHDRQLHCLRTVCEMLLTDRMTTARENSLTVSRVLVARGWLFQTDDPNTEVIQALRRSSRFDCVRDARLDGHLVFYYRRKRRVSVSA